MELEVNNQGHGTCAITVKPLAYLGDDAWSFTLKRGQSRKKHWKLDESGGWYDLEVTSNADASYRRRFAGRVETGEHSISDPAMGQQPS